MDEAALLLRDHILDQKRRYQSVALTFDQADLVLKLIDGGAKSRKKQATNNDATDIWRWGGG